MSRALTPAAAAAVAFALALAAATAVAAASGAPHADLHADLDAVLAETVEDGLVDYSALARDAGAGRRLDRYLDRLAAVDPESLERDARLAYALNLYNATMLRAAADRARRDGRATGWRPDRDDFAVFREPLVRWGGERISLDALEHDIVRARFDEPRIHVALVCAAASCPPLQPSAWRADGLNAALERAMRAFLRDPERNRIDRDARTLHLSRIFDWFAADFGGPERIAAYVDRYVEPDVANWDVAFLEYDWALNARPPDRVSGSPGR